MWVCVCLNGPNCNIVTLPTALGNDWIEWLLPVFSLSFNKKTNICIYKNRTEHTYHHPVSKLLDYSLSPQTFWLHTLGRKKKIFKNVEKMYYQWLFFKFGALRKEREEKRRGREGQHSSHSSSKVDGKGRPALLPLTECRNH